MEVLDSRTGLVPEALEVIQNVGTNARAVAEIEWAVNKDKCKDLADRFGAIGEGMTAVVQDQMELPDLQGLLKLFRKGEMLMSHIQKWAENIKRLFLDVLDKRERMQHKVFKDIHRGLDTCKKDQFDFESYGNGLAVDVESVSAPVTGEALHTATGRPTVSQCGTPGEGS